MGRVDKYQEFYKPKMDRILFALLGSDELVEKWWTGPNKAFEMKTPAEVFDITPDKVITYLLNQYSR